MLDLGRCRGEAAEQHQFLRRRLLGEIGVDPPVVGRVRIGLVGDDHRRLVGVGEEVGALRQRLRLGAGAVERDPPAHFGAGFLRQPLVERLVSAAA